VLTLTTKRALQVSLFEFLKVLVPGVVTCVTGTGTLRVLEVLGQSRHFLVRGSQVLM
jgi:hypothetical protein